MIKDNIFNIKSNYDPLRILVDWLLSNYQDPIYLANITLLLPNRRSCREIKKIFLEETKRQATILPQISAIGDFDCNELNLLLDTEVSEGALIDQTLRPTSELKYKLLLIEEIKKWSSKTNLFGKINIAGLTGIAQDLSSFLDEVERENLSLDQLSLIDEGEVAGHKQQILKFLQNFGNNWNNILTQNDISSKIKDLNFRINQNNNFLKKSHFRYPLIVMGSTGSMVATANLLKTISASKNGFLFFYGLDKNLNEEVWQAIDETHPQFNLKKILNFIGKQRNQVCDLDLEKFKKSDNQRSKLLSQALIPKDLTDQWQKLGNLTNLAVKDLSIIEVKDNFDEARIIALAMKKTLAKEGKKAALITNDRSLSLMVKNYLKKWQININDSSSNSLVEAPIVRYFLNIAEFCINDFKSTNLLTILKHPLSAIASQSEKFNQHLKYFELEVLRDIHGNSGFDYLEKKIQEKNNPELLQWFKSIRTIFEPTINIFTKNYQGLKNLFRSHFSCLEQLIKDDQKLLKIGHKEFFDFRQKILGENLDLIVDSKSYIQLIRYLMAGFNFDNNQDYHPRLQILSTVEARLLSYDLTIISGLNEQEFKTKLTSDNWLTKKMRLEFGLSAKNRQIGVAAYDFYNHLCAKEVIITRSYQKDNIPTLKSHFLMRLEAVLKLAKLDQKIDQGFGYKKVIGDLSQPKNRKKITRPEPSPNLKLRPTKISVTDISKWIRDPYYIYAKRILKLKPLNKIEQQPSFAEFGNFVHKALEQFINQINKIDDNQKLDRLLNYYGKKAFVEFFSSKEDQLLWWPRFKNIAKWVVDGEIKNLDKVKDNFTEIVAELDILGVSLTTKIDRMIIDQEGNLRIVDYKTGSIPNKKDIRFGIESQLALEALIVNEGIVKDIWQQQNKFHIQQINNLEYWKLSGKDKNEIINCENPIELIAAAKLGIGRLIELFYQQKESYKSSPNLDLYRENDYKHLARIDEWQF